MAFPTLPNFAPHICPSVPNSCHLITPPPWHFTLTPSICHGERRSQTPRTGIYLPNSPGTKTRWERGNSLSPNFVTTHLGPFPTTTPSSKPTKGTCVRHKRKPGDVLKERRNGTPDLLLFTKFSGNCHRLGTWEPAVPQLRNHTFGPVPGHPRLRPAKQ